MITYHFASIPTVVASQLAFVRASSNRTSYTAVPNTSRRSSSSTSAVIRPAQPAKQVSFEHQKVRIKNVSLTLHVLNFENGELEWPSDEIRDKSKHEAWGDWAPTNGLTGEVIHRWEPSHADLRYRSFLDTPIILVKCQDRYIPILESGVTYLPEIDV